MSRSTRVARPMRSHLTWAGTATAVASVLLAGCAAPEPAPAAPSQHTEAVHEETPVSVLEEFDFGSADWLFVPHTETYPPLAVSVAGGDGERRGSAVHRRHR